MSASSQCPQCGASISATAVDCKYCGEPIPQQAVQTQAQQAPQTQVVYVQPAAPVQQQIGDISPHWPIRSKVAAGLLGIFLGGWGLHKFYLGKGGMGLLYLLFCWTFIPSLVGFIEGIIYLTSSDYVFQTKNQVRIG